MTVQFLARFCLLLFNLLGWIRLARAIDRTTKQKLAPEKLILTRGTWLLLITACQFHIPFYASRMLPNTFAMVVVLQSYACWVDGQIRSAAALLVWGTAVFRCDLLLLLGSIGLSWLLLRQLGLVEALMIGIVTGVAALLLTVPLDSLLWQRLLWPEGEVFYFNTILGKSKEWGTSPWYWYFTSAIPKAMLLTLLLLPLATFRFAELLVTWERNLRRSWNDRSITANNSNIGMVTLPSLSNFVDTTWLPFLLPILGFVVLYSFLGHKEIRFIFPALPILNLVAALGMSKLNRLAFSSNDLTKKDDNCDAKSFSWIARIGFGCCILCMLASLGGSLAFVAVSRWNYPGGDALMVLVRQIQHQQQLSDVALAATTTTIKVHIDVASAMSGVSLFGQRAAHALSLPSVKWEFVKDGYETDRSVDANGWRDFTHLLTEEPSRMKSYGFQVIQTVPGRPILSLRERRILTEDVIFVMERDGWIEKT
jgi:alpha-1,6-mannosyltransferase